LGGGRPGERSLRSATPRCKKEGRFVKPTGRNREGIKDAVNGRGRVPKRGESRKQWKKPKEATSAKRKT